MTSVVAGWMARSHNHQLGPRWKRGNVPANVISSLLAVGVANCKSSACIGRVVCERLVGECHEVDGCTEAALCEYMGNPPSQCATQAESMCTMAAGCSWRDGVCADYCSTFADEASCIGTPILVGNNLHECHWYGCSGVPKKQCSDYSVESCPLDRCSVNSTCATGDCTN